LSFFCLAMLSWQNAFDTKIPKEKLLPIPALQKLLQIYHRKKTGISKYSNKE
jgi:hypothetical protein